MSLDTAQKRMSVFQLPGLMTNPFPAGVINSPDRQQVSDTYAGISSLSFIPSNQTCWTPFLQSKSPWVSARSKTDIWVREKKETDIWVDEKEILPC